MFEPCRETVGILYAMIFGAGDACINLGIGSLIAAFTAFMIMVIAAQYVARKLWSNIRNPRSAPGQTERRIGTIYDDAPQDDDKFKDSAIWSRKR